MKYGIIFPQVEFKGDRIAIRDFAQRAEGLGFDHILAYDHILGVEAGRLGGGRGFSIEDRFHEPLTLFSFLAGVTSSLEFATGILVLPQRSAQLVAKQAAELDFLSGGRVRLGVAAGWNRPEFDDLGADFTRRGRMLDEQIDLLRLLWTERRVEFEGEWHRLQGSGLNPMPLQRPIPIWIGGHAEPALRRAGLRGDGWMPNYRQAGEAEESIGIIRQTAEAAGRDPESIGIEARIVYGPGEKHEWMKQIASWKAVGATHITLNTMWSGLEQDDDHLEAMAKFADAIGLQD